MAERLTRTLLLAALLALTAPVLAAGGGEFSYMTLNGVKAAAVEIQGIESGFARYGLTLPPLQAAVESRLREGGIEIVSYEDAVRRPDAALVQVKFRTNQSEYQFYFYNLALEVREKIPLGNAAGGFVSVLVWSDAQQGSVQPNDLPRIAKVVDDVVAVFVREYQAQNAVRR